MNRKTGLENSPRSVISTSVPSPRFNSPMSRQQLAFDDVQIRSAHATGKDAQEYVARLRLGNCDVFDYQRAC